MRISRKATWKRVDLSGSLKKEKGKGLAIQRDRDEKKHGLLRERSVVNNTEI